MSLSVSLLFMVHLGMELAFGGGCGTQKSDVPQLSYKIADESHGGGDSKLALRIFANDQWSDWILVYVGGCDWKERGNTDYFDVPSVTARWEAVALYNCGTDGISIEEIGYWNGQNNDETLGHFCDTIGGPSCFKSSSQPADDAFGECYRGDDTGKIYGSFWLDQNDNACESVSIKTGQTLVRSSQSVGKFYFKSDPGVPSCSSFNTDNELFAVIDSDNFTWTLQGTLLSNGWMAFVALVGILTLFAAFKYYKNRKYASYKQLNNEIETVYGSVNA